MTKLIIGICLGFWIFISAAYAYTGLSAGINYRSSPENLLSGGGTAGAIGDNAIGTASNSAYSTELGFTAASVSYATQESGNPLISNLQFDGRTILGGDNVNANATITATITDSDGIDTSASSVEVDSIITAFSALSDNSRFVSSSGLLTYQHSTPFSDGSHTFRIIARDNNGNLSATTISFQVESGDLTATSVLCYPNPYNPNNGTLEITYILNKDADVSVYIFNILGQLIWKTNYSSGSTGGQAGYNSVTWDGGTGFGQQVSNDVYMCRIVSDGKVIGKCKIAVLK